MNIKKKILAISIGPVLVLGIISLAFSVTMVKNSMLDEVKDALKGTQAATLALMTRTPATIWRQAMAISGKEAITFLNQKVL